MEMVPSLIVEITWHLPGGRYHSPSIITADRRRGHPHRRLNQRRPREWPMDLLLRRSARLSTRRGRPPLVSDVHRPTDLPVCRAARWISCGPSASPRPASFAASTRIAPEACRAFYAPRATRGASVDDAGGHGPSTTVAGGRSEPETKSPSYLGLKLDTLRKAIQQGRLSQPGPLEPEPSSGGRRPLNRRPPPPTPRSATSRREILNRRPRPPTGPREPLKTPRPKWARRAPGRTNASWRPSVCSDGAPTRFETCRDVSFGGVLCALPALAANGLFRHIHDGLAQLRGYYSTLHVIDPVGPHGAVPHQGRRAVAVPAPGRVGQAVGAGPRSRGPLSAAQAGRPESRRRPEEMGRAAVPRLAGGRRRNWPAPCMSTGTFASIMAARPTCPNAMSRDSDCACGGPPTTGSTTPWASRSSRSNGRSTTGCWRRCAATSCRVCSRRSPASRRRPSSRPTAIASRFVILFDREGYSPEFFKEMWQDPPHRLHHLPQVSQGRLARPPSSRRSKRRCPTASRSRYHWPSGGPGSATEEERALGAGDPQADHQRASGEPDQHGFRRIGAARILFDCSVDGPRKTSSAT